LRTWERKAPAEPELGSVFQCRLSRSFALPTRLKARWATLANPHNLANPNHWLIHVGEQLGKMRERSFTRNQTLPSYIVRYGSMRNLGMMSVDGTDSYRRGQEVVVKTERGTESGQVLCEASEDALSHLDEPPYGKILREFGAQDAADLAAIESNRDRIMKDVTKQVQKLGLDMQLVDVEQILGRQRVVVYYLAEQRVDFRELVRVLAGHFSCRIEMKQIGVRDEAKLLADYGDCGKPVCCNTHLVKMPPVSMKMAKLQKATLDPTKISGRCGRLKCCLRYEFETYDEIQKSLPNVGWRIVTRQGKAKVIAQQILAEQLLVETEDHRRLLIDASEVLSVIDKTTPKKRPKKK